VTSAVRFKEAGRSYIRKEKELMLISELINIIHTSLAKAPGYFESAANGTVKDAYWCAERMPESWMAAVLMQDLQEQGIGAIPEVRINHDIQWFMSGGKVMNAEDFPDLKNAKIDLFAADESEQPGFMRLRIAVELKGPKSNWQQLIDDLNRLRHMKKVVNGDDQALVFAYVSCPMLDSELPQHDQKFEKETGLKLADYNIKRALRKSLSRDGDRYSYVYLHVV
jgi:hypothetical protein